MKRFAYQCRQRTGSSTAELAGMIAGITLCLIVGFTSLFDVVSKSFESASRLEPLQLESPESATKTLPTATHDEAAPEPTPSFRGRMIFALGAIGIACALPLIYTFRQTRKSKKKEPAAPEPKQIREDPNDKLFERRQDMRRIFRNNLEALLDGHLKARHVMSRQVTVVRPNDSVTSVDDVLQSKKIERVFVVDKERKPMGLVSRSVAAENRKKKVVDVLQTETIMIDAESDFVPLLTHLVRQRDESAFVAVTSNEQLIGVITNTEILMSVQCALQSLQDVAAMIPAESSGPRAERAAV